MSVKLGPVCLAVTGTKCRCPSALPVAPACGEAAGKGMPALRRGNTGDQIVEVQIETPTNLNKKQKELLVAKN